MLGIFYYICFMKSINQIFKTNPALKNEPEVEQLIEYCSDLESQVIESTQSKQFSFEDKLAVLVREIYSSVKDLETQQMEHERWGFESPDYQESVKNLGDYLRRFSRDNNFRL